MNYKIIIKYKGTEFELDNNIFNIYKNELVANFLNNNGFRLSDDGKYIIDDPLDFFLFEEEFINNSNSVIQCISWLSKKNYKKSETYNLQHINLAE